MTPTEDGTPAPPANGLSPISG
jgi:hypothetical protein